MILINGEAIPKTELSLKEYLDAEGYAGKRIAVECNEEIVPRAQHDTFVLHDGDVVEIVSFVGGG